MKNILFIPVLLIFLSSCIGTKIMKLEGKTKIEMFNKLGSPNKIISVNNAEAIYVYYYTDYSGNNYPSLVGLLFADSSGKIIYVQKAKTRMSIDDFLNYKRLQ